MLLGCTKWTELNWLNSDFLICSSCQDFVYLFCHYLILSCVPLHEDPTPSPPWKKEEEEEESLRRDKKNTAQSINIRRWNLFSLPSGGRGCHRDEWHPECRAPVSLWRETPAIEERERGRATRRRRRGEVGPRRRGEDERLQGREERERERKSDSSWRRRSRLPLSVSQCVNTHTHWQ